MFGQSSRLIGLDIGPDSAKIVELNQKGKNIKVTNFVIANLIEPYTLSSDKNNPFTLKLKEIRKKTQFKTTQAVGIIRGEGIWSKYLYLPPSSDAELAEMVRWEIERSGIVSPNEAVIDFTVQREFRDEKGNPKLEILVAYAKRPVITNYIKTIENAGFRLNGITVKSQAYFNFFKLLEPTLTESGLDAKQTIFGILDFGTSISNIIIIRNGYPCLFREIAMGSKDLTKEISQALGGISFEEAESLKKQYGLLTEKTQDPKIRDMQLAIRPLLEQYVSEVERTLGYFSRQFPNENLTGLLVTGGGSRLANFPNFLADQLDLSVDLVDTLKGLNVTKKTAHIQKSIERLTLSLGAASNFKNMPRPVSLLPPSSELLKEKFVSFVKEKGLSYITLPIIIPLLIIGYFGLNQWTKYSQDRIDDSQKRMEHVKENLDPEIKSIKNKINVKTKELKQLTQLESKKTYWWNIFKKLKDLAPQNKVWLTNIDFNRTSEGSLLELSGYGQTHLDVSNFTAALSRTNEFTKVERKLSETVRFELGSLKEAISFKIDITLNR